MMGFKEDLLFAVTSFIVENWDKRKQNLSYFVEKVRESGLTTKDLDTYLTEQGDTCPECVNNVFAEIVFQDYLGNKEQEKPLRYKIPEGATAKIYIPKKERRNK